MKSHHHQGVGNVGEGLREVAWADDGTVEGLEDPERRFALGVLWHPEAGEDAAPVRGARRRGAVVPRGAARVTVVLNPATEEAIAELESAGVEETDAAVARARAAFPAWRAVAPADRARLLRRLATLVEEHHEELSRIESRNAGKPISGARGEIGMVAQVFHFYAGAVDKFHGETIPVAGGVDMTFREPLGVVGLITPWNFPLNIASWKLGPRARVRQHGRAQAGGADAAVVAAARASSRSTRAFPKASSTSSPARARSSGSG